MRRDFMPYLINNDVINKICYIVLFRTILITSYLTTLNNFVIYKK